LTFRVPALDQKKASGLLVSPAFTGLFSIQARIRLNSRGLRTRWLYDSFCQKGWPVRASTRFAPRALTPLSDFSK
jgi:hypothetical protein